MVDVDFLIDGTVPADSGDASEGADCRVVRDPEIVWVPDAETGATDGKVRPISELFGEIEAALGRFDFRQAEDACWKVWSESRAIGAIELAGEIEMLALALDSNAQLCGGSGAHLTAHLDAARAYLVDAPRAA